MQKIVIKNFGPIKDLDIDVNEFMCFIGSQASGKSTISKSIFFFKSLRDDLVEYLSKSYDSGIFDKPLSTFRKMIKNKFLIYWGTTFHFENIYLKYNYSENSYIEIKLTQNEKYIDPKFSSQFEKHFGTIINNLRSLISENIEEASLIDSDFIQKKQDRERVIRLIRKASNELFCEERDLVFIPAGRSLITTLTDQLHKLDIDQTDSLTGDFIERVLDYRKKFTVDLETMIENKKYFDSTEFDKRTVNLAKEIVNKILKGKYRVEKDQERIYLTDGKYIKINYSSSGQQEALWILLIMFDHILNRRSTFIVIEEPEAHLYPSAQYDLIKLIMLLSNSNDSVVILTTHSPYILGGINNLFYAERIGRFSKDEVNQVIEKAYWKNSDKSKCLFIDKGFAHDAIAEDLRQIELKDLDSVGDVMLDEYNRLLSIEIEVSEDVRE